MILPAKAIIIKKHLSTISAFDRSQRLKHPNILFSNRLRNRQVILTRRETSDRRANPLRARAA
jgi:hypothetical protein